ncbi:MAG: hypothetical protein A2583_09210 [Bdellovibrionales bacterium RIFOXYD1_FULL_53_11]|nr:MAG: hypothetical protein A2583_09210 [Bdellovibrionales bacterium RIFOXYD1_FULL_53_11]
MKKFSNRYMTASLVVAAAFILSGCGSSESTGTTATSSNTSASCTTGYVYSSTYGCLLQGTCSSGYGLYNGSCILLSGTTSTGTCIPISQSISFSGSSVQINSSNNIYGGSIPSGSTYGSMTTGTGASISGTTFSSVNSGSAYSAGSFQIGVQGFSSGTGITTAVSGSLTLSSY